MILNQFTAEPSHLKDATPVDQAAALPFVSVIVPCRNEEKHIAQCLDSILASDYPKGRIEILVVDGMSEDRTRTIVQGYTGRFPCVRLVDNSKKHIPEAFNLGIRNATGETIMLMSAHSTCQSNYIRSCVAYQDKYGAENVGGVLRILPRANTAMAQAIVLALGHPFGSGNARAKVGASQPTWSDSAAFGCFKKELFTRIGVFNERLGGSSDMDLNMRIRAAGGRILLVPEIVVDYYADPDLKSLWRHNFADGVWATYVMKFGSRGWSWRHWVPMTFVASVIGAAVLGASVPASWWLLGTIVGAYLFGGLAASAQLALRERTPSLLVLLPLAFGVRHLSHGLGALYGLLLILAPGKRWKGRRSSED